jgi:transposase InsO family protein
VAEQRPQPYRRFERHAFGDLWQGDALHGPELPDPAQPGQKRPTFLFAFIDDHTRLVPHAQFYWHEQLPRLEDCFKKAIRRYGAPLAVYVDRGAVYTSPQFDTACATLGIQRILATAYYPEGKGKIERFFRFVRSDFLPELARSDVTTLYRWEKAWAQGGFEALKPQPRREKAVARAVSSETLDRAEALKRAQPFRSARAIIKILGNRSGVFP